MKLIINGLIIDGNIGDLRELVGKGVGSINPSPVGRPLGSVAKKPKKANRVSLVMTGKLTTLEQTNHAVDLIKQMLAKDGARKTAARIGCSESSLYNRIKYPELNPRMRWGFYNRIIVASKEQ